MNKITVIGIGFKPLEQKASDAVLDADVVLTNSRLLDVFKTYGEYNAVREKVLIHGSVYETMDFIRDNFREKKIALLAAGDPMFYGIGRMVVENFGQDNSVIYPDLSSVQVAFSRARESANDAFLMSLHGGPDKSKRRRLEHEITDLPRLLEKHGKMAVLTDNVNSPDKIAEVLQGSSPQGIKIYVCEKLGYDDERIISGTPEEISAKKYQHPNVVIIKTSGERSKVSRPAFGLREPEIKHSRGLITKDEVRAVTLHKLRLPGKGVFWDIGAGSGSVSLEAGGLCPDLEIYAIEKTEDQTAHIKSNLQYLNILNIHVIHGEAPGALESLPSPDRVFIGGSGGKLSGTVRKVSEVMDQGITVINATTIDTLNEAVRSLEDNSFTVNITEVSVSRSKAVGTKKHMSALNPIFIITGERK